MWWPDRRFSRYHNVVMRQLKGNRRNPEDLIRSRRFPRKSQRRYRISGRWSETIYRIGSFHRSYGRTAVVVVPEGWPHAAGNSLMDRRMPLCAHPAVDCVEAPCNREMDAFWRSLFRYRVGSLERRLILALNLILIL